MEVMYCGPNAVSQCGQLEEVRVECHQESRKWGSRNQGRMACCRTDRQMSAWPAAGQIGECIRLLLLAAAVGLTMKTRASCDL